MNAPLHHSGRMFLVQALAMLVSCGVAQGAEPEQAVRPGTTSTGRVVEGDAAGARPPGPGERVDGPGMGTTAAVATITLSPEIIARFAVTTHRLEAMVLRDPIVAPGTVAFRPETTVHVGTVVLGRVATIHAQLGDAVNAGDPLVTIDSPDLGMAQNEWLQKRAAIAVVAADADIAEQTHLRAQLLAKDDNIAAGEAQRRAGDARKAQAALLAARVAAQTAENTLRIHGLDQAAIDALAQTGSVTTRLVIRAALAGTVIASGVTVGEVVRPETEALMTIADTRHLVVIAQVPSADIPTITIGSPARVTTPGRDGNPLAATVAYIAPQVDADTRTVQVRLLIEAGPGISSGSFVDVEISPSPPTGVQEPAIIAIPRTALFSAGGAAVVFVAEAGRPGTFSMRKVAIAPARGTLIPIISGVEAGDALVDHGGFVIKAEFGKAGAKDED